MSYRLLNANELAIKYPEVNDMPCVYADLPNGLDGELYTCVAIPRTEWIPVAERLPKEDGTYLVTVEVTVGTSTSRVDIRSFAKDLNRVNKFDFPHKRGWYDYDSEYGYWEDTRVIAWMPLPKPYKAGEEE